MVNIRIIDNKIDWNIPYGATKDYWVAGLTNDYTAAVWIGYDTPRSMEKIEKAKIHFSIFNAITD